MLLPLCALLRQTFCLGVRANNESFQVDEFLISSNRCNASGIRVYDLFLYNGLSWIPSISSNLSAQAVG